MTIHEQKNRLFVMIMAVVAAVFLFACGGAPTEPPDTAEAPETPAEGGPMAPLVAAPTGPSAAATPAADAAPRADAQDSPGLEAPTAAPGQPAEQAGMAMEPEPIPAPAARTRETGARVYNNKDLERYRQVKEDFGLRDDVVVVDLTKKPSAESSDQTPGMTRAQRDAESESTRQKITDLLRELDYEKKRVLPLENPFVPRPQVSEDDKLAEAGMNNKERLDRVKQRIGEIEAQLGTLQHRLAELQSMKPSDEPGGASEAPPSNE